MSEAREPIWAVRLWRTPWRDLIRLRVSGRLDWRHVIARADLPDATKTLLTKLLRKTRLWRLEKTTIANELIAHFQDALTAGQSADEATELFGDWKKAAKLIRRATKRKRSYLWHAWRWGFWSVVVFAGLYLGYGVYLVASAERHVAVDYAQMMNAQAAAVPEAERGWPIFRDAMVPINHDLDRSFPSDLSHPASPELIAFIDHHAGHLAQVREAAAMPGFGYRSAFYYEVEDLPLLAPDVDPVEQQALLEDRAIETPRPAISLYPGHLGFVRQAARLLSAQAMIALERGDNRLAYDNLVAVFQLASHVDERQVLIDQYVSISINSLGFESVSRAVTEYPDGLTDEQLRALAHRIAILRVYSFDLTGEKWLMLDMLQRVYTDDGKGGGRLHLEGWNEYRMQLVGHPFEEGAARYPDILKEALAISVLPAVELATADRRELTEQVDRLHAMYQADLAVPMYERSESAAEQAVAELVGDSVLSQMRYSVIAESMPAIRSVRINADLHTARADGVLAGLALERYRREHGRYPDSLDALAPRYLPAVPIDRITGEPIRYRLSDGRPIVYSVGADRDDDGGYIAYSDNGRRRHELSWWTVPEGEMPVDGDWVVWPLHD